MKKTATKKVILSVEGHGQIKADPGSKPFTVLSKAGLNPKLWVIGEPEEKATTITYRVTKLTAEKGPKPNASNLPEPPKMKTVYGDIEQEETATKAPAPLPPGFIAEEMLTGLKVAGDAPKDDTAPIALTLPLKETVAALKIAVDIASGKNIMPILRNIKIEATGNKATIQATDLEKAWSGIVPSEGGPIVSCIPALVLLKEIQALPAGTEKVELLFRGSTASHSTVSVNGRCDIVTQDPEEYPEIKPAADAWSECRDFLDGLKRVMPAVSVDQTRYALTGVYLDFKESKIVGTDGFRMHVEDIMPADASMPPAIIPLDSCKVIAKHGTVNAIGWLDEKHIACPIGCGVFSTRVIEGNYPDWKNVMPKHNENVVTFRRDEFLSLFVGASIIEKERLTLTVNGELVIQSEGSEGNYKWHIPCGAVLKQESMTLHFNGRFLVDAIRSFPLEEVVLKVPDTYGACLLNGKAVVMPIRV